MKRCAIYLFLFVLINQLDKYVVRYVVSSRGSSSATRGRAQQLKGCTEVGKRLLDRSMPIPEWIGVNRSLFNLH
uniref:Putative secreted protein n=1 Tax=Anopheles darlingi TaxID=43151 RepID=A0A2M4DLQ4_ANODA